MSSQLKISVGAEDHSQGAEDAPVTLVEYGDYECPHCARAHGIVKRAQKHFKEKLRFVFRNFPLTEIHPNAEVAAEAAEFAANKRKFWEMHDAIFENQDRLSPEVVVELAVGIGLDRGAITQALKSGQFAERVKKDFSGGVRSGVNGTPTFFIDGKRHDGSFEYDDLVEAINQAE